MHYRHPSSTSWSLILSLLVVTAGVAQGQAVDPQLVVPAVEYRASGPPPLRLVERRAVRPLATLRPAVEVAPDELDEIARWNRSGQLPVRNGFSRPLPAPQRVSFEPAQLPRALNLVGPSQHAGGLTARTLSGDLVWGAEVQVEGAYRLRLHLSAVEMPPETLFWIYGEDGETVGPFGLEMRSPSGELWTPSVGGTAIRLEVQIPGRELTGDIGFVIDEVLEIFRLDQTGAPLTGSTADASLGECLVDAQCIGSGTFDVIDLAQRAIGYIEFVEEGQNFICSGGLLNDSDPSSIYFLTANHCISNQKVAVTVEIFWDYHTPSCDGALPDLATLERSTSSTLVSTGQASDFTLLQLFSIPSNRILLGWNANPSAVSQGTTLHRVSHPFGRPQSYSRSTVDTIAPTCFDAPRPNNLYHTGNQGATFGGSSGAPVILAGGQAVGQLLGGCGPNPEDSCDYNNSVVDGAFSESFPLLDPFLNNTPIPPCTPTATAMCLNNGRYQVELDWRNQFGAMGPGPVVPFGSDDSGLFYFDTPSDWQMLIKVLNGCPLPGFQTYWVFYAATTNVEFTLTVTDTARDRIKQYYNPLLQAAPPIQDTQAFATCP